MIRTVAGAGIAALLCSLAYGQNAEKKEFEVASVKEAAPMTLGGGPVMIRMGVTGGPGTGDPGRISYDNMPMMMLLTTAYGVKRNQISGPEWLGSQRFDITAKVPEGATKDDVKVMLQNLLAERFGLKLHHETKEMSMYALVVAKNGPKLKDSTVTEPEPDPSGGRGPGIAPMPLPPPPGEKGGLQMRDLKDGCPEVPAQMKGRAANFMFMTPAGACMVANGVTLDKFADQLSNQMDRPVMNLTELNGKYDIKLRFDPSSMPSGRGGMMMMGPPPGGGGGFGGGGAVRGGDMGGGAGGEMRRAPSDDERPPTIFAALQEQLGLKLDARKGSVDMLVIDHLEKAPTEN